MQQSRSDPEPPLLASEMRGYGFDPLAPLKDAATADGDIAVPLGAEASGFWLKAFGRPRRCPQQVGAVGAKLSSGSSRTARRRSMKPAT